MQCKCSAWSTRQNPVRSPPPRLALTGNAGQAPRPTAGSPAACSQQLGAETPSAKAADRAFLAFCTEHVHAMAGPDCRASRSALRRPVDLVFDHSRPGRPRPVVDAEPRPGAATINAVAAPFVDPVHRRPGSPSPEIKRDLFGQGLIGGDLPDTAIVNRKLQCAGCTVCKLVSGHAGLRSRARTSTKPRACNFGQDCTRPGVAVLASVRPALVRRRRQFADAPGVGQRSMLLSPARPLFSRCRTASALVERAGGRPPSRPMNPSRCGFASRCGRRSPKRAARLLTLAKRSAVNVILFPLPSAPTLAWANFLLRRRCVWVSPRLPNSPCVSTMGGRAAPACVAARKLMGNPAR